MSEDVIKLTVEYEISKNFLVDEETFQAEYGGNYVLLMKWFVREEGLSEVLSWADGAPKLVEIKLAEKQEAK